MVLYDFSCPECGETTIISNPINKDFPPLSCEQCQVPLKQKFSSKGSVTCTSGRSINDRCKDLARSDKKKIESGNDNALSDLVGDKVNPLKD